MHKTSVSVSSKFISPKALSYIYTNRLIICCSDVSTSGFSNQSSIFSLFCSGPGSSTVALLTKKIGAVPRILLNARLIDEMAKTKINPRAQHADKTQTFIVAVQQAMETFKDEISLLSDDIRQKAYKNFLVSYRDALTPIWNLARFASIETVINSIVDKEFTAMAVMAQRLKPKQPTTEVLEDGSKIPDLEAITTALKQQFLTLYTVYRLPFLLFP